MVNLISIIFVENDVKKVIFIILIMGMLMFHSLGYASDNNSSSVYLAPKFTVSVLHIRGSLTLHTSTWGPRRVFGARAGGALALGYDFWRKFQVPFRL